MIKLLENIGINHQKGFDKYAYELYKNSKYNMMQ